MMADCATSASASWVNLDSWSITAKSGWLMFSRARARGTTLAHMVHKAGAARRQRGVRSGRVGLRRSSAGGGDVVVMVVVLVR